MQKLTDFTSYEDAQNQWHPSKLWDLFNGDRNNFNISYECIDRHASDTDKVAVIVAHSNGYEEFLTFDQLSRESSHVAFYLEKQGVKPGERVGIMLEPGRAFYATLFGAMKMGAIVVPLFTLFGPEGLRLRVEDCTPSFLFTNADKASMVEEAINTPYKVADNKFFQEIEESPNVYETKTSGSDLAIFQYTSGTTRELPDAIKHNHKALVTLMVAGLHGTGIRPGDRFFCPSSPAWGHGLWHGTLAPLALGITIGAFSGKFDAAVLLKALSKYKFNNISAAATHYRMIRNCPDASNYEYFMDKLSYTGEPIDSATESFIQNLFNRPVCSMYGTTEIGVVLVSYPGAEDFIVKSGSLGKPIPGGVLQIWDSEGNECEPGKIGEMMVQRRGEWIATKDLGQTDEDGYFYHAGRADDVIISAGWTMSAVEIEDAILKHPEVLEAAAIGVPDELRGQVVKAFIVSKQGGSDSLIASIQNTVRSQLAAHEYPRQLEFVDSLPKTPAGKVHRKKLREQEKQKHLKVE